MYKILMKNILLDDTVAVVFVTLLQLRSQTVKMTSKYDFVPSILQ